MEIDEYDGGLSAAIIGAAIEVHKSLGPGLLEHTYEGCLCRELEMRGLAYQQQVALPVRYKGTMLDCGYRLDVLVGNRIVVEIKAVEELKPIHEAQLLTYLRLSGYRIGLLINFNVRYLRDGILRRVL